MRKKYAQRMQQKLCEPKDNMYFSLAPNRRVKLEFLSNESYRKYLKRFEANKSEEAPAPSELVLYEDAKQATNSESRLPSLTLNALMHFKPVVLANGSGSFEHGRPKMFRPNI